MVSYSYQKIHFTGIFFLIHTSPEGFDPIYKMYFLKQIMFLQKEIFCYLSAKESFAIYQHVVFILKVPFHRRKFFLSTSLQKDFIMCIIRKDILMIHISTEINQIFVLLQKEIFWCNDMWFSFWNAYSTEENSSNTQFYRRIGSCI